MTATRGVLAVLACFLLVVGCGGATEEASAPPASTAEARDAECPGDRVGVTTAYFMWGADGESGERPLSETLAVFERPRTPADATDEFERFARLPAPAPPEGKRPEDVHPGSVLSHGSRLLLSDLGSRHESLFAAPTTNGWVCSALGMGGGGCTPRLTHGINLQIVGSACAAEQPTVVYGLAANDVDAIRVDVGSSEHEAVVGANGFFAELPAGTSANEVEALVVVRADGNSERVTLPSLRR